MLIYLISSKPISIHNRWIVWITLMATPPCCVEIFRSTQRSNSYAKYFTKNPTFIGLFKTPIIADPHSSLSFFGVALSWPMATKLGNNVLNNASNKIKYLDSKLQGMQHCKIYLSIRLVFGICITPELKIRKENTHWDVNMTIHNWRLH